MSEIEVPELALSMIQPMGTALVRGWKPIENRKWKPWPQVIGKLIAIHASAKYDAEYANFIERVHGSVPHRSATTQSAIIGVARVVTYVVSPMLELQDERERAWFTGPFGWRIADAREIEPIPCKGFHGLWKIPDEKRLALASRLEEASRG